MSYFCGALLYCVYTQTNFFIVCKHRQTSLLSVHTDELFYCVYTLTNFFIVCKHRQTSLLCVHTDKLLYCA